MAHVDRMLERLPTLYREGELLAAVTAVPAGQLEILDEEMVEVQRAHWFDTCRTIEQAARLAALLDIEPESWQQLSDYRPWVHELRDAILEHGSVTVRGIQRFVEDYSFRFQRAVGVRALPPISNWLAEPSTADAAFVENPPRRRELRVPETGGVEPLHRFTVTNGGLAETDVALLLVGQPGGPERVPVIANLSTGRALVFRGSIPEGQRLWIRPTGGDGVEAGLEGADVSDRLQSVEGFAPGVPWSPASASTPARPLTLARGHNELWFLTVAHHDLEGLDRVLLALAPGDLEQGRWDDSQFDRALYYQDPGVSLRLTWVERRPAAFEVHLPAGTLLGPPGETDTSIELRARLAFALALALTRLKAAGVHSDVRAHGLAETQPQGDYLVAMMPKTIREAGPTGADRLPDPGAVFDVTGFDDSIFTQRS